MSAIPDRDHQAVQPPTERERRLGVGKADHAGSGRTFIVNGKFLSAEPTGVHRVAGELVRQMFALLGEGVSNAGKPVVELWIPPDGVSGARKLGVPYRVVGRLTGIPWEQISLPWHARGRTVVSLCNVGPMAMRDAVTMFHDAQVYITPDSYSRPFRLWYKLHQPVAGRRHRRILTVSDYSRVQISAFGVAGREKIGVVANGIDHVVAWKGDPAILGRLQLRTGGYVVALANTQPHKNVAVLLRAFGDPALRDLKLVLFGSASADHFRALGVEPPPNAVFAGRLSDDALRSVYENALCLAFPSTTEGFGLPPLEAMSFGCPAIAAPAGALPQVCGDAAVYADPRDPAEWVRKVRRMADDPDWRAHLVAAGLEQAGRFTWRNAARKLIEELESC